MKQKQLIALLLVVIMAVATIPTIAAAEQQATPAQTPTVGAYRTPTLTITHTPTFPYLGQWYTVSGRLSWGAVGLSNRQLIVWVMWPQNGRWQWTTHDPASTDANGYYHFHSASKSVKEVWWKVRFGGDRVYYSKNVYTHVYIGVTQTSIYATKTNPYSGEEVTIYGYVRTLSGKGLGGYPVAVYWRSLGDTTWNSFITVYTNVNGYYSMSGQQYSGTLQFKAEFQGKPLGGSNWYWSSQSRTISVTWGGY